MINRSYTWINEDTEHSDADTARAGALAKKWSSLMSAEEDRTFRRIAESEDENRYDPYEDCECDACLNKDFDNCQSRAADNARMDAASAERDLEIELIQDKLERIGARMMRPYEHWNEDERYMQYAESGY